MFNVRQGPCYRAGATRDEQKRALTPTELTSRIIPSRPAEYPVRIVSDENSRMSLLVIGWHIISNLVNAHFPVETSEILGRNVSHVPMTQVASNGPYFWGPTVLPPAVRLLLQDENFCPKESLCFLDRLRAGLAERS